MFFGQRLDHTAVECALIGLALVEQFGIETTVERQQRVPQSAETLAQLAFAIGIEVGKETPDEFFLRVVEKVRVIQFFEFLKIAKQLRGIGHVLVHIVEIRQNAVGPTVEGVERELVGRHIAPAAQHFHIVRVETAHTVHRIVEGQVGKFAKQLADGHIERRPDRGIVGRVLNEVVIEE